MENYKITKTIPFRDLTYGLGNRVLGLCAIAAIAKILNVKIETCWAKNQTSDAYFLDLFKPIENIYVRNCKLKFALCDSQHCPEKIYETLDEHLDSMIPATLFYKVFLKQIRNLSFSEKVENKVNFYLKETNIKQTIAVHIRRTDRYTQIDDNWKKLFNLSTLRHGYSILRRTGLIQCFTYLFLGRKITEFLENRRIYKLLDKQTKAFKTKKYMIVADSMCSYTSFKKFLQKKNANFEEVPSYTQVNKQWEKRGKRETSIESALVEMIIISKCKAIIQNLSVSTFSGVAAIMGKTPILSEYPPHPFWKKGKIALGHELFDADKIRLTKEEKEFIDSKKNEYQCNGLLRIKEVANAVIASNPSLALQLFKTISLKEPNNEYIKKMISKLT